MVNNKLLIIVVIIALAIVGVVTFSINNNMDSFDSNPNTTTNTTTIDKNISNISSNNSKNNSDNGKNDSSLKQNPKNQKIVKNPKPKLISKNEAIRQAKLNLKKAGIKYSDVGPAELVKSDGKYYWAVWFTEPDGRPSAMYINARSK